jgi:hypothetical protein
LKYFLENLIVFGCLDITLEISSLNHHIYVVWLALKIIFRENIFRCGVVLVGVDAGRRQNRVILDVIPMSLLCPSKNGVAFKITIELVIDQNSILIKLNGDFKCYIIFRGTQEGHVYNI